MGAHLLFYGGRIRREWGGGAKEEVGVGGGGVLRKLNLVHSGHLFFFSLHQQHSVPPGNLILYRRWRFAVEMPSCFFSGMRRVTKRGEIQMQFFPPSLDGVLTENGI